MKGQTSTLSSIDINSHDYTLAALSELFESSLIHGKSLTELYKQLIKTNKCLLSVNRTQNVQIVLIGAAAWMYYNLEKRVAKLEGEKKSKEVGISK